jgi:hypothetical protein
MVIAFPLADACADFRDNARKPIGIPRYAKKRAIQSSEN